MRRFGGFALLLGVIGYFYCSAQKDKYPPLPQGLSLSKAIEEPAGQWELGEYACAALAAVGGLMLLFPQGR